MRVLGAYEEEFIMYEYDQEKVKMYIDLYNKGVVSMETVSKELGVYLADPMIAPSVQEVEMKIRIDKVKAIEDAFDKMKEIF